MDPSSRATLQLIREALHSPAVQTKLDGWIDVNCLPFTDVPLHGENKLEWTALHEQYQELVETALENAVSEQNMADLCNKLPELVASSEEMGEFSDVLEILMSMTEFEDFKLMMVSRAQGKKEGRIGRVAGNEAGAGAAVLPVRGATASGGDDVEDLIRRVGGVGGRCFGSAFNHNRRPVMFIAGGLLVVNDLFCFYFDAIVEFSYSWVS